MRIPLPTAAADLVRWAGRLAQRYEQDWTDLTAARAVLSVTASRTLSAADFCVLADATGGAVTLTLPSAVGLDARPRRFKRLNAGANAVTIAAAGSETIDGAATKSLASQYATLALIPTGSGWAVF